MSHVPYHTHTQTHTHTHTHIYDMTRLGHMSHDSFHWNCTPPNATKSRNSNALVQTQIKSKSQFEFVPRDTEESEFLDLVVFGDVAISVETVIHLTNHVTYQLRQTRHVPRMKKSQIIHVPQWGMSHIKWVMSHIWVTSYESCQFCELGHVPHMSESNESCPTYMSFVPHMGHVMRMITYQSCHLRHVPNIMGHVPHLNPYQSHHMND